MDLFLIKHSTNNQLSLHIIENYFFDYLTREEYPFKTEYFQINKILPQKYIPEYYFTIPFKILNKILKSLENSDINSGEFLTNKIFIPSRIWTNSLFNQENIPQILHKYELFKTISKEIQILFDSFNKFKFTKIEKIKIDMDNFCDILLRFQAEFSILFRYIKSSDLITKEQNDEFIYVSKLVVRNLDHISVDEMPAQTPEILIDSNYIQTFTKFLKLSLSLEKMLNYQLQIINENYIDNSNDDTYFLLKDNEYFMNKKLLIGKFYSETVLKFLLYDIKDIILKLTKNK